MSAVGAAVCPLDADSACISEKMDVVSRSLERSKGSKSKIVEYKRSHHATEAKLYLYTLP